MSANDYQVGGDHYHVEGVDVQHWDVAVALKLGYFEGQITRYLSRWRKKNGIQDLDKALHFLDKLIENWEELRPSFDLNREYQVALASRFVKEHDINGVERDIILNVFFWRDGFDLKEARRKLAWYLDNQAELRQVGTPDDGGQHSRQEG